MSYEEGSNEDGSITIKVDADAHPEDVNYALFTFLPLMRIDHVKGVEELEGLDIHVYARTEKVEGWNDTPGFLNFMNVHSWGFSNTYFRNNEGEISDSENMNDPDCDAWWACQKDAP